jgi:GTP-binding protein
MFVDHIKIFAKAGDGGCGSASFRREKFVPKGGPDGGDGGRGGDIILRVDPNVDTLSQFFYEPIIKAKSGDRGQGKQCYGRSAKPVVLSVPAGTLVHRMRSAEGGVQTEPAATASATFYDLEKQPESETETAPEIPNSESQNPQSAFDLIADLTQPGDEFVLCKGGEGGKGNLHFKSGRNRTPRQFTEGEPGEEGNFYLELRKIADAGLIGYPNAGKSTLLGKISAAHPKVAPYPFTTLHPQIGIMEYPDWKRLTVCDVPGLIEGAHKNVGLGHKFLRHIQRCKILVLLLDMAGTDNRKPWDDYKQLLSELELYDPALLEKPRLVVANKMDEAVAEKNLKEFKKKIKKVTLLPISAAFDQGMEKFRDTIRKEVKEAEED